jgi:hypothetical protein
MVLGDSHVRSFSQSTAFLPIFVGAGKHTNFVSRSNATRTTKAMLGVLGALDRTNVERVIVYASEPATRSDSTELSLNERAEALVQCLDAIRRTYALDPIAIAAPPTISPEQNERSLIFNSHLRAACERHGFLCFDLWDETASLNPDGIGITPKFAADGVHLDTTFGERIGELLNARQILEGKSKHIELDYVYHLRLCRTHQVRIRYGAKMAQSMLAEQRTERAARAIDGLGFDRRDRKKIAVIGCSDGYPAFRLAQRHAEIVAVDDRPEKIEFAKRLRTLLGATSLTFLDASRNTVECRDAVQDADLVVITGPLRQSLEALVANARGPVADLSRSIEGSDATTPRNKTTIGRLLTQLRRRMSRIDLRHPFPTS